MDPENVKEMRGALKRVFDICGKTQSCVDCPALDENGVCTQYESAPYSWKIEFENRARWRTKKTWREEFEEKQGRAS